MTTSFLLVAMICVGVIVIVAGIALIALLTKDQRAKPARARVKNSNWIISWFIYLILASLLAFWSFWISLFFLFTAWILSLNPGKDSTYEISKNEINTAKRVYNWLFWSSVITVPVFLVANNFATDVSKSVNNRVFAALLPLIFHIPLLLGFTSKSTFVYRHTQQGILLIAIRAIVASIAVSTDLWWIFIVGNGSLWLSGTIWGRNQVVQAECWWMNRKGETIVRSRNEADSKPKESVGSKPSPEMNLERSRLFAKQNQKTTAIALALEAFRSGDSTIKKQAVQLLESFGEVEQF